MGVTTDRLLFVRRGDFLFANTPIVATATLLVPMSILCET
jgi:hypothetical protein